MVLAMAKKLLAIVNKLFAMAFFLLLFDVGSRLFIYLQFSKVGARCRHGIIWLIWLCNGTII